MSFRSTSLWVVATLVATQALALPQTYVATSGKDVWPCNRDKPCRTFARALSLTDPGGSIVALDSGRFADNYLDIRQSVSIVAAPGVFAELTAPGGSTGVVFINAAASDVVLLRGLTITGQAGTPLNGIVYNNAHALHVEDCVVTGVPTKGILALTSGRLFIKDSIFRGNYIGVSIEGAKASLDRVRLEDNEFGLFATLGAQATVRDSVAAGNNNAGFLASVVTALDAELNLENCTAANNGTGIRSETFDSGVPRLRVSGCVVTNNGTGLHQIGAAILESRGNNTVRGNTTDVSGILTPIAGT